MLALGAVAPRPVALRTPGTGQARTSCTAVAGMADAPSAPASSASPAPDGLPAMKCHTPRGQPWSPPPGRGGIPFAPEVDETPFIRPSIRAAFLRNAGRGFHHAGRGGPAPAPELACISTRIWSAPFSCYADPAMSDAPAGVSPLWRTARPAGSAFTRPPASFRTGRLMSTPDTRAQGPLARLTLRRRRSHRWRAGLPESPMQRSASDGREVDAHLIFVYFTGDRADLGSPRNCPANEQDWQDAL